MEIFFCLVFLFLCAVKFSCAKNVLYQGEILSPNQNLVSESGEFKFGFFTNGSDRSNSPASYYYIGIWLSTTAAGVQPPTLDDTVGLVWVGNRENPVLTSEPAAISLSRNGDLIVNQSQKIVWSSNVTQAGLASGTVLDLLDTGNLVLRNRSDREKVIWQSFFHPANTWFPGAVLGFTNMNGDNINISLASWKAWHNPSPGRYSLEINSPGTRGFIIRNIAKNSIFSYNFPALIELQDLHNGLFTFNYTNQSATQDTPYFHLYSNGVFQLIQNYYPIWSTPGANCGSRILCGPNALCVDSGISPSCKCPYGFSNMSSDDTASSNTSTGCVRNIFWNCNNHLSHESYLFSFNLLQDLTELPDNSQYLGVLSQQECEDACRKNCSCTAYASGIGCNLWYGDLVNIMTRSDGVIGKQLYIRIAISSPKTKLPVKKLIIGGVTLVISITCLILLLVFRGTLLFLRMENNNDQLSIYSYAQIKYATKQFSVKLGGGGFGVVFKGRLPNNTEVAVKKLKVLGQEEKQFRSEVQTIGMIRRTNLVRLLGFCTEGTKRLLVYEYMSNGSLDSRLFTESSSTLSWQERFAIAVGIAKGLTYLHEECRDCIIHCDIKPENVLLDENLVPKIADFGMAKLLGRDLSRVLTTIRGTIGYLAPEWYSGDAITTKADVYSFGMMLFEIISGNRNLVKFNDENFPYFPFYAMVKINEGEVLCLVDEKLGVNVNPTELIRASKVAGWCIQDSEANRPTMGKVSLMLQGIVSVGIPPVPSSFWNLASADDY